MVLCCPTEGDCRLLTANETLKTSQPLTFSEHRGQKSKCGATYGIEFHHREARGVLRRFLLLQATAESHPVHYTGISFFGVVHPKPGLKCWHMAVNRKEADLLLHSLMLA